MFGSRRWVWSGVLLAIGAVSVDCAFAQSSATRSSSFAYDGTSGLLTQEVIEPNTSALRLQSDYSYNAFGQRTQVTVSGVDIATRSATTTYDTKGRFPLTATNPLGQSESWQYDGRFGLPSSHTGPNGLTTTWSYDNFGRKILEVRADGTRTTWIYQFCSGINGGTAACPSGGVSLVTTTVLASNGVTHIGPVSSTYVDLFDRTIATDTQGFDGSLVRVATEYNSRGLVYRKSRPYFVAGGTPKWTTYTYDVLGRVLTETAPDGGVTSTAYHGLSTTVTNAQAQTKTTLKNSQGQVVSVTDAVAGVTTYTYDPFANVTQVVDAASNTRSFTYDTRGRKISSTDPDLGLTTYTYDVLDQLKTQTNASSQVTTFVYDLLRRPTQRVEADLTSTWTYDSGTGGVGKLSAATTNTGYSRSHTYDALGRPTQTQITVDGINHVSAASYDSFGRINTLTYPSGFGVTYAYNATGYQSQIIDSFSSQVYWTANARDAEGHLTQQTGGNGVVTSQTFDANTGLLTGITAGNAGSVASFAYTYDTLGKLTARSDANTSLSESFGYDSLNRLTSSTVSLSPTPLVKTFSYDAVGRLTSKSDVGTYAYPATGQPRPHGVTSISGGIINTSFTYDGRGNMTAGNGVTVTYTSYNMPHTIARGTATLTFAHDPEHQRYKQSGPDGTTLYVGAGGIMAEKLTGYGGAVTWTNYLTVGGQLIGMRVEKPDETVATRYFHKDHLGSIAVMTDEAGAVVERFSYDAWGKRRFANGTDDPTESITSQSTRGFTEHEQLTAVGLVHMNGRVYDPLLARFATPDPMTENAFSTQGWNRYSYVGNSPVNFTDPSGYCFLGCFWKPIFKAVDTAVRAIGNAVGNVLRAVPILGTVLQIAAGAICGPGCAVLASAFVAGVTSGNLGQALKAGFISMVTVGAFELVGDLTAHGPLAFGSDVHLANVAGHAAVGCMSAMASGGRCGSGALSGAVGSFASPLVGGLGLDSNAKLVALSAVGGLASVAGGGKFENGAVTAAFGYLFNESGKAPNERHSFGALEAMRNAIENGYEILSPGPTLATIPGAPNRSYDFVMSEPGTGRAIGAEVKTSWWGIIRLNDQQVSFDVQVAQGVPAFAPALGRQITGVQYYTYCFMCGLPVAPRENVTIGSAALWLRLQGAGINSVPVR